MNPDNEIVVRPSQAPELYDPEAARERMRTLFKAQVMPPRDLGNGKTEPASDDETDLIMAEADALGLDILAGQAVVIRNRDGVVELWRTWEGLVAIAQATGEYDGFVGPYWSDGKKEKSTDEYSNLLIKTVWTDSWDSDDLPRQAMVGVLRKGQRKPNWGKASYSAWGTDPEWIDETDAQGNKVPMREKNDRGQWVDRKDKFGRVMYKRRPSGKRVPKQSAWWQMPKAPHQLALTAFKIGLKATFQPDKLRKATMAAAKGMTREERLAFARELLGRDDIDSFNDLDPSEYAEVYDELRQEDHESAPPVPRSEPGAEGAPAEPGEPVTAQSDAGPGPADSSAGEGSPTAIRKGASSEPAPAEPLSAGTQGDEPSYGEAEPETPAEYTPDEGDEEAPESAAGEAREDRGREAAAPPEPTPAPKPRRRPPAPSVAQVREAQQDAEATRKQTTVDRPPSAWLLTLPPKAVRFIMDRFSSHMSPGQKAEEFVAGWVADHPDVVPPLETWQRADDWPTETINALVADLPPKEA